MGLSNNETKQAVTTHQVLLELIQGLKTIGDSGDFAQLVKDAYALPDAEQAKADEARANIKQYQDLIAEQKQRAAGIEASQDNLDLRAQQIKDAQTLIDNKNADLAVRETTIKTANDDLAKKESALDAAQAKLELDQAKLVNDEQTLTDKQKEIADYETALKAKAAQLKDLTQGM